MANSLPRVAAPRVNPSPALRRQIFLRDDMTCQYCAATTAREYVIDHVFPVAKGGPTVACNLVVACVTCNQEKRDAVWLPINLEEITADQPEWQKLIVNSAVPRPLTIPLTSRVRDLTTDTVHQYLRLITRHKRNIWEVTAIMLFEFVEAYQNDPDGLEELLVRQGSQLPTQADDETEVVAQALAQLTAPPTDEPAPESESAA